MLTEFDKAFSDFERDGYSLLHECHFNPAKELRSFEIQVQAQSLATDVGYLSMVMRDLHQAAIQEVSDEMDRYNAEYEDYLKKNLAEDGSTLSLDDKFFKNQSRRERRISIALAKLGAAFKTFLFPIRAYQDAIYKIGLCILSQSVGGDSSMTKAVDIRARTFLTRNSIGKLLAEAVPNYATWFASHRGQRDFIKYGAGISYNTGKNFVTGETTVSIKLHTSSRDGQDSMCLDDVTCALQMSAAATKAIIEFGVSLGKFKPRK